MLEREVERRLGARIRRMGGLYYKWTSPGSPGVPDRIAVLPDGTIWFVELKTDAGRLSPIQQKVHDAMAARGVKVHVTYGLEGAYALADEMEKHLRGGD